jgi:DNA-binding transcriptional MerR regulator
VNKLTIGQLAKQLDIRTSAIRYYEEKGLIQATERSSTGYRLFEPKAVEELKLLQRAQTLGFSLEDIKILLNGWREGNLDQQAFMDTTENRYLALERELTALLALRHELGLFLQDIYLSSPKKTPALILSQLIDHICTNPEGRPSAVVFDRLLERAGCNLTSQAVKDLMEDLDKEHIHVWNEGDKYSILIVTNDPRIAGILDRFTELVSDCQVPQHSHLMPRWQHSDDGYLLTVEGAQSFIIARLFLEINSA